MDVTKPYEFIGFGAMDVTKPYEFIGFGAMDVTKPCEFIGFGAMAHKELVPGLPGAGPQLYFFDEKGWGTTRGPFRCS